MRFLKSISLIALAGMISIGAADAATFGPAGANLSTSDVPLINIGAGTITFNTGNAQLSGGTGEFAGITPTGNMGSNTIHFSTNPGSTITTGNNISSLFTFTNSNTTYTFDLSSVETTNFSNNPGVSTVIGLYLLGDMFTTTNSNSANGANSALGKTATPTALAMTFSSSGGSNFQESGILSNPPAPPVIVQVPEPASIVILGVALMGIGLVRRRNT